MGRRDARHGRRWSSWLPIVLVLTVLAAAAASYRLDLGERWFGIEQPSADPSADPAEVPAPPGLTLPAVTVPALVAVPATGALDPVKVRRAVARMLDDPDLGRSVRATVAGLDGVTVYNDGSGTSIPASTTKLLTSVAALESLGAEHTFATTVVAEGTRRIVLVGGGDPFLASSRSSDPAAYPQRADITTLAARTAKALKADGRARVRLGYDTSLFTGPEVNPHWPATYLPEEVVAPITSLWVDEGRPANGYGRVDDPAAVATATFAKALRERGIRVVGTPTEVTAAPDATELARVTSTPLDQIVRRVLDVSDNEAAEVLSHQVGLAETGRGTFADGARSVLRILADLGIPTDTARVYDGSGLSRDNRLDTATLTALLEVASSAEHPELRPIVTGLPVAGFTGSLADRFPDDDDAGRGVVRAKTGTLTGVSGLAGIATSRDGHPVVFALIADRVALADTLDARDQLDRVAAALAACRCGR